MLQFEINKTIAESYNPRNERLYTIMYYGMVRTLPHSVEEMSKKNNKKHKMSKFSCVHSVQILNAIIHLEVEPKYTHIAQSNECDDSSSIDCWIFEPLIMFFQCALSLSFSISFWLFSVSGSVLYSEKFSSIFHHSSAKASTFLLGGWKMLLSLVHKQSSVYTKSIQIVENFLQYPIFVLFFLGGKINLWIQVLLQNFNQNGEKFQMISALM